MDGDDDGPARAPGEVDAALRALLADGGLARSADRRASTMLTVGEILREAIETLRPSPVPSDA